MENRAPCKHIFCPYTHPQPPDGFKRSNHFSLKVVILRIKLKGLEQRAPLKHLFCPCTHILRPCGKVKTFLSEISHVAYQIK